MHGLAEPPFPAEHPEAADSKIDFVSLNEAAVSWLATWVDEHPQHNRAVGQYYQERINRRSLLSNYDVAVAEYCRQLFSRTVTFFELGCGFGELSLMLALDGFPVIGFEADRIRYEGAALLAGKVAEQLSRSIDLTVTNGIYPLVLKPEMLGNDETVLVCTGVTGTYMAEHSEELIESLQQFDHVIIDVTRFGLVRDGEAQAELIHRIMGLGYTDVATVSRVGGTDIRHFSRQRIGRAADAAVILYSDVGQPVPVELQRDPLHIFSGAPVPLTQLFPHLRARATAWKPAQCIAAFPFAIPATSDLPAASHLPVVEGGSLDDSRVHFPRFGAYYINCQFGTVKCLILDPTANRDAIAIEVSRFLAGNIVHSSVDKATILPWRNRTRYVRPDLLLRKMFTSDQPLGLQCDGATDFAGYIFTRLGYNVKRIWIYDPDKGIGHVVLEVYFSVQEKWVMLDFDFGVVVTDSAGMMLSTREIMAGHANLPALLVKPIVEKHWLGKRGDVGELYVGQMSWMPAAARGGLTAEPDRYLHHIEQLFRVSEEYSYRFRDGFDDNVHDIV